VYNIIGGGFVKLLGCVPVVTETLCMLHICRLPVLSII